MSPPGQEVTRLLLAWGQGDQVALHRLIPVVHQELQRLAHCYMAESAPATASRPPRWLTKLTCGWWTAGGCAGRTGPISSLFRPG